VPYYNTTLAKFGDTDEQGLGLVATAVLNPCLCVRGTYDDLLQDLGLALGDPARANPRRRAPLCLREYAFVFFCHGDSHFTA